MSDNWYRRYTRKALAGMAKLSLEERGAYNTLIDYLYLFNGPLEDDDAYIAGLLRCHVNKWRALKKALLDKQRIVITDGMIDDELAIAERKDRGASKKQSADAGHKGGTTPRRPRDKADTDGAPEAHPADTQATPAGHQSDTDGGLDDQAKENQHVSEATASPSPKQNRGEEIRVEENNSDPKGSVVADATLLPLDGGSIPDHGDGTKEFFEAYNLVAQLSGVHPAKGLTKDRRPKVAARIRDHGLQECLQAISTIPSCPFLCGENDRGWKANFDWLLQASSFNKLVDGFYEGRGQAKAAVRRENGAWIVTHGTEQFEAWRGFFKRTNSSRQYDFRDDPGLEVKVEAEWPSRRQA